MVAGIVTKCLNARPKTKDMGVAVCLMYVETEKQDIVLVRIFYLSLSLDLLYFDRKKYSKDCLINNLK